ncbi:hypothetical protein QYF36_007132 [Acer negundo]|nr:hypothetical protein QYF36_007132 [Acer negundo]
MARDMEVVKHGFLEHGAKVVLVNGTMDKGKRRWVGNCGLKICVDLGQVKVCPEKDRWPQRNGVSVAIEKEVAGLLTSSAHVSKSRTSIYVNEDKGGKAIVVEDSSLI